jgi:hypothetical protein
VARVAASVERALALSANCRFVPGLRSKPVPGQTAAVSEVQDGRVMTIQLQDPLSLDGLHDLCDPLMDAIERALYQSFTIVDKVYVYRSPVSYRTPSASWIWHYDNHPREVVKVMVYLTDVDEASAPFEYIRGRDTARPLYGAPLAPTHGSSRIPSDQIERHLADGFEKHAVVGPRGTVIAFDDNIVHRGTLAQAAHRDVVVFQVRPATFRAVPRINPRWTGSFNDRDINANPTDLVPHTKRRVTPN